MRSVVIVGVPPTFEAALLGCEVGRGRLCRFGLQVAMHALVGAVVLRGSRARELDLDPLLDPPDTEAGKAAEPDGGERHAMVDADDIRQPSVAHQATELMQRALELLVGLCATAEHVVTVEVADGERVAALAVAQEKPAFEVHRPHVIGLRRLGEPRPSARIHARSAPSLHAEPVTTQDLADRRAGRRRLQPVPCLQDRLELLGSPPPMPPAFTDNQRLHFLLRALGAVMRSVAAWLQCFESAGGVTLEVLVGRLAADPKLLAQVRDREPVGLRQRDESNDLFHWGDTFPRHLAAMCYPSLRIKCHLSRRIEPSVR